MARKRLRLHKFEAEFLGLEPKEKEGTKNARYYLNPAQYKKLQLVRTKGISDVAKKRQVDIRSIRQVWLKDKQDSVLVKNPFYEGVEAERIETLYSDIVKDLERFSPKFPKVKRKKSKDNHLLVVDPADIHIGKLASAFETGEDYNSNIAVQRCHEGVEGILNKASGFNIDKVLFVAGNDILHYDTPRRTTTSGTPQDTDGMWYDNFLLAKQLYVDLLMKLLSVADVHFVYNPSNHDYQSGFFLADVIKTYFKNCKNITFDCSIAHRKYFSYHDNLIGTTHGDGAKTNDLALLMANESQDWVNCNRRYYYIHHFHHKISKDYPGVSVEALRSPSGADSYHHRQGYQHQPKAIEGFIHHPNHGQVARLTHFF